MKIRIAAVAALIAIATFMGAAQAAVILSSYSARSSERTALLMGVSNTRWEAIGFWTGPIGTYTVDSVTMPLSGSVASDAQVKGTLQAMPIPEPSTVALMLTGLASVGFISRWARRRNAAAFSSVIFSDGRKEDTQKF